MELATLFFTFSHRHYLKRGGTIAFVMPRSVLTGAKQHRNFQRGNFGFVKFLDLEGVGPLFNVPSCVIVARKGEADRRPVPVLSVSGRLPRKEMTLRKAREFLNFEEAEFTPPHAAAGSPYLGKVFEGASIYPRCFWFVRPPEEAKVVHKERPYLETDPEVQKQAKEPWREISLSGEVEAEFLFATLLSTHLLPFGWRKLSLLVLPLIVKPDGSVKLLNFEDTVEMGKTGLANWLRKAEALWEAKRKGSERVRTIYERLDYNGLLTSQRPVGVYKVVYNTHGTHLCSAVLDLTKLDVQIHGLDVRGFLADTVTFWFETENEDEAHYLCAVLNSPMVDEAIKPFQTKGTFGARDIRQRPFEVLPIPKFDPKDRRHLRLSDLSKACHEKVRLAIKEGEIPVDTTIGRLRSHVRRLLQSELKKINEIVQQLVSASDENPSFTKKRLLW